VLDLPLFDRLRRHRGPALVEPERTVTYPELAGAVDALAAQLLGPERLDLDGEPVALLLEPGADFAVAFLAVLCAGGIAVPLALSHPPAEWDYVLADSGARRAFIGERFRTAFAPLAQARGLEVLAPSIAAAASLATTPAAPARAAFLVYTSGTTGRPKGVVWTHGMLAYQLSTLEAAWGWTPDDRALALLPLHHIHGLVNVLLGALYAGAAWEPLPRAEARAIWARLAAGGVTVLMAVPTLYHRLIEAFDAASASEQAAWAAAARALRLAVSGSAALPARLFERWRALAGTPPLERYGMSEIGMALSNPLVGERRAGSVGQPLAGVEVRRVDEAGAAVADGEPGELEVRGPGVFARYWRRPAETAAAFRGGWFRTGDVAVVEAGSYRLLGRSSTDIVKIGGYKVSALEVEACLSEHPAIAECAVVGLPDEEWGERLAAAVVLRPGAALALEELRRWAADHLAPYKLPTRLQLLETLPRNALGKVLKGEVRRNGWSSASSLRNAKGDK
jgi:malonyl-CoA/methylmalonyl-CoA synthetase